MSTIPKPKYCGQNWLDMKPIEKARLCGQCEKIIIDFSKKKWANIEKIQRDNNNSVCGMYSEKQLKFWGQEIPRKNVGKTITNTSLFVGLLTTSLIGQAQTKNDTLKERTVIQGIVTGETKKGELTKLIDVSILLEGSNIETFTDINGSYRLDITDYIDTIQEPTILVSGLGYNELEIKLDSSLKGDIIYNAQLKMESEYEVIAFYVSKPTLMQRIKWKFRKWFGRD